MITPLYVAGASLAASVAGEATKQVAEGAREAMSFLDHLRDTSLLSIQGGGEADGLNLDDLANDSQKSLTDFAHRVSAKLSNAGIPTSFPIQFESNPDGTLKVTNDHPDAAEIERLINEEPELVNEFHRLEQAFGLLGAAKRHEQFLSDYAANPLAPLPPPDASPFRLILESQRAEVA